LEVLVAKNTYNEGEGAVVRQGHLIAVVASFLMGCAVLVVVGCAGVRSGTPREEQGHTQATTEQERSPQATTEEARCEGTRTFKSMNGFITTNDIPGCPNGGLLSGTDKADALGGLKGEDEIHGLGGRDWLGGGGGNDIIYGGPGVDFAYGEKGDDVIYGGDGNDDIGGDTGEDVLYGGKGNDKLDVEAGPHDGQRDKLYCGEGKDVYMADKSDYVDSSCEKLPRKGWRWQY